MNAVNALIMNKEPVQTIGQDNNATAAFGPAFRDLLQAGIDNHGAPSDAGRPAPHDAPAAKHRDSAKAAEEDPKQSDLPTAPVAGDLPPVNLALLGLAMPPSGQSPLVQEQGRFANQAESKPSAVLGSARMGAKTTAGADSPAANLQTGATTSTRFELSRLGASPTVAAITPQSPPAAPRNLFRAPPTPGVELAIPSTVADVSVADGAATLAGLEEARQLAYSQLPRQPGGVADPAHQQGLASTSALSGGKALASDTTEATRRVLTRAAPQATGEAGRPADGKTDPASFRATLQSAGDTAKPPSSAAMPSWVADQSLPPNVSANVGTSRPVAMAQGQEPLPTLTTTPALATAQPVVAADAQGESGPYVRGLPPSVQGGHPALPGLLPGSEVHGQDLTGGLRETVQTRQDGNPTKAAAFTTDPTPAYASEIETAAAAISDAAVPESGPAPNAAMLSPSHSTPALEAGGGLKESTHLQPRVGLPGWGEALGQKIVWMAEKSQQTATLTLNPPDLGPMQIVLSFGNNQLSAAFLSPQPEVRAAIEAAMPKLNEMLGNAGIQMGESSVGSGASNPGGGGNGGQPGRRDWQGIRTALADDSTAGAVHSGQGMIDAHV